MIYLYWRIGLIKVLPAECQFSFSRSSGAGGQNVNKVNTKATLSWDINAAKSCSPNVKKRFVEKYGRYLVGDMVVIISQRYRSQKQNISDCIHKLEELLNSVRLAPKTRKATRPTRSSVKKRLDGKTKKSRLKKMRGEKF